MKKVLLAVSLTAACTVGEDTAGPLLEEMGDGGERLSVNAKLPRYTMIRDAARARGIENAYLLAGIGNTETGLAMCWSEATWACKGPNTPDCGGGPIIAGSADGACSIQQGGLGIFQFDAGTYQQTINKYGNGIVTVAGQTSAVIDYTIWMVKISAYTTNAETDEKAKAWINNYDPNNPTLRDQWIKTVLRYYNGCQPGWSCWTPRIKTYTDGYNQAINDPGGLAFWRGNSGTRCGNSPTVVGEIEKKYKALGGCTSILGAPISAEMGAPDRVGRYSVFEKGSIYWTPTTGAFEVHGRIRDAWKDAGWEAGALGYPTSNETTLANGNKQNTFERGSITWNPSTDQTTTTLTETAP